MNRIGLSKGAKKRLQRQIAKFGIDKVREVRDASALLRQAAEIHQGVNEFSVRGYTIVDRATGPEARQILEDELCRAMGRIERPFKASASTWMDSDKLTRQ